MACDSAYLNHTGSEKESGRVLEFLKEIAGEPFDHEHPDYYGRVSTLNKDTARLCDWCRGNADHMGSMSLELQLWWKRHQAHDAKREADERAAQERQKQRDEVLAILTEDQRALLGFIEQRDSNLNADERALLRRGRK